MMFDQTVELLIDAFGGENTVAAPAMLPKGQSRRLRNGIMTKLGALAKRPGSAPLTTSALSAEIKVLTKFKGSASSAAPSILASSGNKLYKFDGTNTLTAQTMTNTLSSADIYAEEFTNSLLSSRLVIADTGDLKAYNGTAVATITPAPDDALPAPANALVDINAKGNKYLWVHSGHIFVSPGTNELFYSKRFEYDYFPSTQFFFLVRDNDYINGPGITYNNVCLIPMRRGWSILSGTTFDDFDASQFLNTVNGVIAPRSIARITYPTGSQTIVFLSDDGIHEIYDTGFMDTGVRQYATRSLMKDKVDFNAIGLTEAEKTAAVGYYDATKSQYVLRFNQGANKYIYVFDTRNGEWYPWTGVNANTFLSYGSELYFGSEAGHLCKFQDDLYSDWEDADQTTGTPVDFDRYSDLIAFEDTGYMSYLDYYMLWGKQYTVPSTMDMYVVFISTTAEKLSVLNNQFMTWGVTSWDTAVWANLDYTDIAGNPQRVPFHKKSFYFQIRWRNNRDQPIEVYREKLIGRLSGG